MQPGIQNLLRLAVLPWTNYGNWQEPQRMTECTWRSLRGHSRVPVSGYVYIGICMHMFMYTYLYGYKTLLPTSSYPAKTHGENELPTGFMLSGSCTSNSSLIHPFLRNRNERQPWSAMTGGDRAYHKNAQWKTETKWQILLHQTLNSQLMYINVSPGKKQASVDRLWRAMHGKYYALSPGPLLPCLISSPFALGGPRHRGSPAVIQMLCILWLRGPYKHHFTPSGGCGFIWVIF